MYEINLHTNMVLLSNSTQILPDPLKLWTEAQHVMGIVLERQEADKTGGVDIQGEQIHLQ